MIVPWTTRLQYLVVCPSFWLSEHGTRYLLRLSFTAAASKIMVVRRTLVMIWLINGVIDHSIDEFSSSDIRTSAGALGLISPWYDRNKEVAGM